jgi:endonuclease G
MRSHRFLVRPELFYSSNQSLDYAVVAVSPQALDGGLSLASFGFHRLIAEENKIEAGEWITIVQHPGGRHRQFSIRENQLLALQDPFLWYASDTAQGSSGAPAFNDSFQVVALHHSGKAKKDGNLYVLKDGSRVASLQGVDDSQVVWEANEGLRISRLCHHLTQTLSPNDPYAKEIFAAMQEGDIMTRMIGGREIQTNGQPVAQEAPVNIPRLPADAGGNPTVQITIAAVNIASLSVQAPAAGTSLPSETREPAPTREDATALLERTVAPMTV